MARGAIANAQRCKTSIVDNRLEQTEEAAQEYATYQHIKPYSNTIAIMRVQSKGLHLLRCQAVVTTKSQEWDIHLNYLPHSQKKADCDVQTGGREAKEGTSALQDHEPPSGKAVARHKRSGVNDGAAGIPAA